MNIAAIKPTEEETYDLAQAAAYLTKGCRLLHLRNDSGRYSFIFADKKACEALAEQFWADELLVPARSYSTNLKVLKSRIYAGR